MSWWPAFNDFYHLNRPSRTLDQHFGLSLDDIFEPRTKQLIRSPSGYLRPWRSSASQQDEGSTIKFDKDQYVANLDVQQFKPDEVTVKVTGENTVTVEGKHEEKEDEHGFISRQFVRRYVIPRSCDINKLESKLSSDGVLSITAPIISKEIEQREIPVVKTGEPAKQTEKKMGE